LLVPPKAAWGSALKITSTQYSKNRETKAPSQATEYWVLSTIFVTLDKSAILLLVGIVAGEWPNKKEGVYAWQKELPRLPR